MSDELPEGWAESSLGSVIRGFEAGRNLPGEGRPAAENDYGVLKISAVTWGEFDPTENKALPAGVLPRPHEAVASGDLLISRANTGDLVGAVVKVDRDFPNLMLPDKILRLLYVPEAVDPAFLMYALRGDVARSHFRQKATGTSDSMRNLSQPKIEATPIRLAPMPEQRRIVEKIEVLLARVDGARDRLAKVAPILKRLRQSILASACSGRLTDDWRQENRLERVPDRVHALERERHALWLKRSSGASSKRSQYKAALKPSAPIEGELPAEWDWVSVSQVALLDVGFAFPSAGFTQEGIRLLRGENVEPGRLRWADTKFWPSTGLTNLEHLLISEGDLILAMDRPVVSAGLKLARAQRDDLPAVLVQRVMRFACPNPEMRDWLHLCLGTQRFIGDLVDGGMTGTDLPHITGTGVAEFGIPLPSAAEQREIVRRVGGLFALLDAVQARVAAATSRADKVTQAILAKAFSGELVSTEAELARAEGRDYESAPQLLERIRSQTPTTDGSAVRRARRSGGGAATSRPQNPD